ncbi:MAG: FG-GAP repeat domain-containing protein [Paracoccaceae bacterium]
MTGVSTISSEDRLRLSALMFVFAAAISLATFVGGAAGAGVQAVCDCSRAAQRAVCFEWSTDRYGHGVLPEGEWAQLTSGFTGGAGCAPVFGLGRVTLPKDRVFEDRAPRLADLDGDGQPEVVVVESSLRGGAELAIYAHEGRRLVKRAATPPIGARNRWRAVVGIADLDADGRPEIAEVVTPHIGGTLRLWAYRDGALTELASAEGYSNHRIGERAIVSAVRDCGAGPELVLPDFGWRSLRAVRLWRGGLHARDLGLEPSDLGLYHALLCRDAE